jgi:UDP-N-acetylglucosamine 4,6-dehydratase/5-epimerase
MTRFIITPQQAVQLVFDAIEHGIGGEVFVPKLPSFMITDLIEILKQKHKRDVATNIIGIRPGEKIHELMINSSEIARTYEFGNLYVISSQIQKYRDLDQMPPYAKPESIMDENKMPEYSSKDSIISKEETRELFRKIGLI